MRKNTIIANVLIATFLFAFSACNGGAKKIASTEEVEIIPEDIVEMREDQIKLAEIETGAIELKSLSGMLKVSGKVSVAPQNLATVCMPMGGFIKSTTLVPGSSVKKGQTLAIIENPAFVDLQQNYLEAKNRYEYVKADYDRQKELYQNEVGSQKNFQQVTSDYKTLKVQINALEQKLTLIGINPNRLNENTIHRSVALASPIAGYVKTVNVTIGKSVIDSDVLFEIVNTDRLFLELSLFEKDASTVSKGQKIKFYINNEAEQHEAVVYQTSKSINMDKTFNVYANVVKPCNNILPGMYVNALIQSTGKKETTVPSQAIVSFEDKDYIFLFDKDKVESGKNFTEYRMIQIKKGITDGGFTAISLPENVDYKTAKIVTKGAYNLLSAKKNAGEMSC